jgi:hypothetical protein
VVAALSFFGLFAFLSAAIFAVLLGSERGPRFIRSASYLYSRPSSAVEWFGLLIAASIAASTQISAVVFATSYRQDFGTFGSLLMCG